MRTVAVVQARMGSSRLPGKILRPLAGRPVLWHVVERLRRSARVDEVVLATSTEHEDDATESFGRDEGLTVVRGSKENVLERYLLAAERSSADVVVRVTGDAPLLDPDFLDAMIDALVREGADRAIADPTRPCLHEGFSVLTRRALEWLRDEAGDDPVAREHVTGYFEKDPGPLRVAHVAVPDDVAIDAKLSVDTPADLAFLERVHVRLGARAGEVRVADVAALLRGDPELRALNAHVRRKRLTLGSDVVLLRCDASGHVGFGHLFRCIAVAEELRDGHGYGVVFAMDGGGDAAVHAERAGFAVDLRPPDRAESEWFAELAARMSTAAILLDCRSDLPRDVLQDLRRRGVVIATLDDPTDRRLDADLAFYPPVRQVQLFDWTGFSGELLAGWGWVPLRRAFRRAARPPAGPVPRLIVSMGGSDPFGVTERVLDALAGVPGPFEVTVALGPGWHRARPPSPFAAGDGRTLALLEGSDLVEPLASADLAILSFGVTAFEAAALGTPAVYLCLTDSHALAARSFEDEGAGLSLGLHDDLTSERIAGAVTALLRDVEARERMSKNAAALPVGEGAERIADRIARAVMERA